MTWEYLIRSYRWLTDGFVDDDDATSLVASQLDLLGAQGWELVTCLDPLGDADRRFVFKRQATS